MSALQRINMLHFMIYNIPFYYEHMNLKCIGHTHIYGHNVCSYCLFLHRYISSFTWSNCSFSDNTFHMLVHGIVWDWSCNSKVRNIFSSVSLTPTLINIRYFVCCADESRILILVLVKCPQYTAMEAIIESISFCQ